MTVTINSLSTVNISNISQNLIFKQCGWYDWFCSEPALRNRSKPFISLAKKLSSKFGGREIYLKNCCPLNGSLYDRMGIYGLDGDQEFVIEKQGVWTLIDIMLPSDKWKIFEGNKTDLVKFLLNYQR